MSRILAKFFSGSAGVAGYSETPTGTVNGTNAAFALSYAPNPAASLLVMVDGVGLPPSEYTLSGLTLTLATAPTVGQNVMVYYTK